MIQRAGVATRLRAEQSGQRNSAGERFFLSPERPKRHWTPPNLLFSRYQGSFQGLKRPGRDVAHLPSCTTQAKNEWAILLPPPPLKIVCGMFRDNFTCNSNQQGGRVWVGLV